MDKRKILTIIGTRPEAIKLAPVVIELGERSDCFVYQVCATAQHRELLDQALAPFAVEIHYDLDIMALDQSLARVITARAVERLDGVIAAEHPDVVLVQGDTTTAFCGALVGYYH